MSSREDPTLELLRRRLGVAENRVAKLLEAGPPSAPATVVPPGRPSHALICARCHAIIRAQLGEHGGYEVKSQGDGFMLAFPSARQAVMCAMDIQRALARRSANGELPVRVRIGIHTGEAIHQDGDFYGRSVVCAARIAGQAEGAEILASALVRELVQGRGDVPFREAGEFELKGLAGRQRLFRVVWAPPGSEAHPSVASGALPSPR